MPLIALGLLAYLPAPPPPPAARPYPFEIGSNKPFVQKGWFCGGPASHFAKRALLVSGVLVFLWLSFAVGLILHPPVAPVGSSLAVKPLVGSHPLRGV